MTHTRWASVGVTVLWLCMLAGAAAAQTCVQPPAGLVSWWPGDGDTQDIVGGNHGTLQNGTTFAPGMVGQTFSFDGIDDFVEVPDSSLWTFGDDPFTIDLWVNFAEVPDRASFVAYDEGPFETNKWIFWFDNIGHGIPGSALRFHINSPSLGALDPVVAPWSPNTGQWYYVAVTRSGSTYRLFIDGVQVATNTDDNTIPDADAPLTIGQSEGGNFFNGLIDEVEIYNRALSAVEIQAIFAAGSAGKCKPDSRSCQGGRGHIRGRVTTADDGTRLPGVVLRLGGPDTCEEASTSRAAGFYLFPSLREGTHTVTPSEAGCTFEPPSRTVTLEDGGLARLDFAARYP